MAAKIDYHGFDCRILGGYKAYAAGLVTGGRVDEMG